MSSAIIDHLTRTCEKFTAQAGKFAVMVQSRTDRALSLAINAQLPLPSASVIKTAIACAAFDAPDLDLRQPVTVSDLDATFYCSIIQAFDPGDQVSLKALIGLMLIVSDNPATSAVLDAIGKPRVNAWLDEKGLRATNLDVGFEDASLGTPLRANLTTASDCLRLLQMIDTDPAYAPIKHMLANNLRNERIPKLLPDEAVIAHKTGTLNGLCHDIAIVESPEAAFYLVVLADGLPEGRDFAGEIARFSKQVYDLIVESSGPKS